MAAGFPGIVIYGLRVFRVYVSIAGTWQSPLISSFPHDKIGSTKEVLRNDALISFFRRCFCSVQGLLWDDTCTERFLHFNVN